LGELKNLDGGLWKEAEPYEADELRKVDGRLMFAGVLSVALFQVDCPAQNPVAVEVLILHSP
jgi:hypothetical protein